jgi:hypothetical protein
MGDNGNSGDAITQTSTGYFLNQMFMFISCIIMNIVMFNCGLNIHTCVDAKSAPRAKHTASRMKLA